MRGRIQIHLHHHTLRIGESERISRGTAKDERRTGVSCEDERQQKVRTFLIDMYPV